jgi:hypothetical protein
LARFATNTRAREEQADHCFQEIIDIADNATPETVNVARLRVDSRKFAVARLAPKKYGDHVEHEHSGSSQHLVAVVNLLGAPDDASLPLPQKPAIRQIDDKSNAAAADTAQPVEQCLQVHQSGRGQACGTFRTAKPRP